MDLPVREQDHEHQCVCDLVLMVDGVPNGHDRCFQSVFSPDQPMCDECEAAGHADLPNLIRP